MSSAGRLKMQIKWHTSTIARHILECRRPEFQGGNFTDWHLLDQFPTANRVSYCGGKCRRFVYCNENMNTPAGLGHSMTIQRAVAPTEIGDPKSLHYTRLCG